MDGFSCCNQIKMVKEDKTKIVLGHMCIMLGTYANIELDNPLKKCTLLVIG